MKLHLIHCCILGIVLAFAGSVSASSAPDFSAITNSKEKKMRFFNYLYPIILKENHKILIERNTLKRVKKITPDIIRICKKYSKSGCADLNKAQIKTLLTKVDIIPPSLALAQAASESAWGTSRFAKSGNNYFGQWCYSKNCGLIPKRRSRNDTHEVQTFSSVDESVSAYLYNLNTGAVYKKLRAERATLRAANQPMSSIRLAEGLISYSQRGEAYVKDIQRMIETNNLVVNYDKPARKQLQEYY